MYSRLVPLLFLPVLVSAAELRLLHRLVHPSLPAVPFAHRGTLQLSGSGPATVARLASSETLLDDLRDYAATLDEFNDALYQVALEHPGDVEQTQWATSHVPAVSLSSL